MLDCAKKIYSHKSLCLKGKKILDSKKKMLQLQFLLFYLRPDREREASIKILRYYLISERRKVVKDERLTDVDLELQRNQCFVLEFRNRQILPILHDRWI